MALAETAGIGHNVGSEFDELTARIADLTETAERWARERPKLEDQEQADKCTGFIRQLKEARKEADEERRREKKPHDDAGKAVQEKYLPHLNRCKAAIDFLQPRLTGFLKEQERIRQEKEAVARREAEEAERQAAEARARAEEIAKQAEAGELAGTSTNPIAAQEHAEEAEKEAKAAQKQATQISKARPKAGGQYVGDSGARRSMSMRKVWRAKVTNYDQAFEHFKHTDEVKTTVLLLANRLARTPAGRTEDIPGVEFVSEDKVGG